MIFTIVFGFVIFPLGMVLANYYFSRRCPKCRKLTLKQQSQQVLSVTRNYRLVEYTYVCPNCGAVVKRRSRNLRDDNFGGGAGGGTIIGGGFGRGMGGGMGFTHHTCGAVNAGLVVISSEKGRKNPYARETFAERVDELHHPGTGIYPRHGAYVKECIKEYGTMECRDLCLPFDESTPEGKKDRARNCKKLIGFCTREAVKAALRP